MVAWTPQSDAIAVPARASGGVALVQRPGRKGPMIGTGFTGAVLAVREVVCAPDVDPAEPVWRSDGRCSVLARLARALGRDGPFDGVDAFARRAGVSRAQLVLMLRAAGAGPDPFGPSA